MEQRFKNKIVVVTGAGSGIGKGAARRFLHEGAFVVLAGRTMKKLEQAASGFDADRTLVLEIDVAEQAQVESLIAAAVDRFGRLDVLVNNAGIAPSGKITEASVDDWHAVMRTNVDGVFYGCRAAMPHLISSKGCIVNTSSVSGLGGDWGMSFYNATKGAVSNFTRALALDHGRDGVRVNAVAPSFTITGMTDEMAKDEAILAKFRERMPLGRPATPDDVAGVIAFLASDDARFVTGVVLPVDGGVTASNGQPAM